MNEDEIVDLQDIFYREAPYNYVLTVSNKKEKHFHGACSYEQKACVIFGPDAFTDALPTMLHEIAHANINHKPHSDAWEKEFVRLLAKYKIDPEHLEAHPQGPNVREYIERTK